MEKDSKAPGWLTVGYIASLSSYVFAILELTRHISGIVRTRTAEKQELEFLIANPHKIDSSMWSGSPLDVMFAVNSKLVQLRNSLTSITAQLELCEDILLVLQIAKNHAVSLDYNIIGPPSCMEHKQRYGYFPLSTELWREYVLTTRAHGNLILPRIVKTVQHNGFVMSGFNFSLGKFLDHTRQFASLSGAAKFLGDLTTGQYVISDIERSGGVVPYLPPQMQPKFKSSEQPAAPART